MGRDQLGTSGSISLDIKLFSKSLDSFPSCKIGNTFNNRLMPPDSSVGKESTCNAGDPGLIRGLGRSTGEGTGYPLQYFWVSLVAQLVKNVPAMWESLV